MMVCEKCEDCSCTRSPCCCLFHKGFEAPKKCDWSGCDEKPVGFQTVDVGEYDYYVYLCKSHCDFLVKEAEEREERVYICENCSYIVEDKDDFSKVVRDSKLCSICFDEEEKRKKR